jgi:hypothetical protein
MGGRTLEKMKVIGGLSLEEYPSYYLFKSSFACSSRRIDPEDICYRFLFLSRFTTTSIPDKHLLLVGT